MKHEAIGGRDALCDEIAGLARNYLENPDSGGIQGIDRHISHAVAEMAWDQVSKWHRVRLRLLRFQQQRAVAGQMASAGESRN